MSHDAAIREVHRASARVVREIDTEIARIQRDANRKVAELKAERAKYAAMGEQPRRRASSQAIAGPAALATIESYLAEHGTAFQSDITADTGLNSGTVTHALRHLASEGKILMTGLKRRNSPEVSYIAGSREPVAA